MVALIPVAASWIHLASVSAGRTHSADDVPQRGVGMVLGAKTHPDRPSAFLAARLDVAVDLFERGKVRALLVSGLSHDLGRAMWWPSRFADSPPRRAALG